jgi:hypothetical protein
MRLAILSNQLLDPWISWSMLGPRLFSALSSFDDSELVAPPPLKFSHFSRWRDVVNSIRKADTLFWIQPAGRPENPLDTDSYHTPAVEKNISLTGWDDDTNRYTKP